MKSVARRSSFLYRRTISKDSSCSGITELNVTMGLVSDIYKPGARSIISRAKSMSKRFRGGTGADPLTGFCDRMSINLSSRTAEAYRAFAPNKLTQDDPDTGMRQIPERDFRANREALIGDVRICSADSSRR